jgi:drug/metabolite transporter (DMT)-like permease
MNETPMPAPDQARLSITCALGGSLAFSINDITVKSFSATLPLHEVVLFRALVALIVTVAVFAPDMSLSGVFRTRRLSAHLFRGFCVVVSNLAYFAALAALPLAETSAIFFIAPLLITALSAILLREHVGPWRWAALGIGMIGVLLIVKPGTAAFQWAVLLPAVAALAYAGMHTMTRKMGLGESAATMAVYIQLNFIAVCLAMGLAFGGGQWAGMGHPSLEFIFRAWSWPGLRDLVLFLLAGACSAAGGYLMSQAYRSSAAGLVAPFEYSALVLAVFWGFALWGEVPGYMSTAGILMILSSGVFVAVREAWKTAPAGTGSSSRRR